MSRDGTHRNGGLKALRIELGLTQTEVAGRAISTGRFREGFGRHNVLFAEAGIGLGSSETMEAIAVGLGLRLEEVRAYLRGELALEETVAASTIKPNPEAIARLRAAESKRERRQTTDPLPNLRATLEWCEGQFPDAFLRKLQYKLLPRKGKDLERLEWYEVIRVKFLEWREHQASHGAAEQANREREPMKRRKGKA